MMGRNNPVRLVICCDGTWCTEDGANGKGNGNITNVYRICASVKTGMVQDPSGRLIEQDKIYQPGVGSANDVGSWARTSAGVWGTGFGDTIRELYQKCCLLDEQDEVWLYGFSRGAYIVRAVAGLLHFVGCLKSASDTQTFTKEYKRTLEVYDSAAKRSKIGPGQVCLFSTRVTKV